MQSGKYYIKRIREEYGNIKSSSDTRPRSKLGESFIQSILMNGIEQKNAKNDIFELTNDTFVGVSLARKL